MSSYSLGPLAASLTCPGCLCRDRVSRYPSDLTDAQWAVLGPEAEQVMAEIRRATGRPMVHELRAMVDAIGYVARNGIEWRALPVDFPPWEAVYAFFQRWSQRGLPQRLTDRLRGRLREALGRHRQPSAAIVDSESVKGADTVGAATRGFDGGNYADQLVIPCAMPKPLFKGAETGGLVGIIRHIRPRPSRVKYLVPAAPRCLRGHRS